jgi:hypothetical protein
MYATYNRHKRPDTHQQAILDRTREEYFTKLRQAPGLVSHTVIHGDDGETLGVTLWERPEDAAAFQPERQRWAQTLDQNAQLVGRAQGEVNVHVTPQTARQG